MTEFDPDNPFTASQVQAIESFVDSRMRIAKVLRQTAVALAMVLGTWIICSTLPSAPKNLSSIFASLAIASIVLSLIGVALAFNRRNQCFKALIATGVDKRIVELLDVFDLKDSKRSIEELARRKRQSNYCKK